MKIYRYYPSKWGIHVLRHLKVRTSLPNDLNDPFEFSPNIPLSQFDAPTMEILLKRPHIAKDNYQREGGAKRFGSFAAYLETVYLPDIPARARRPVLNFNKNVADAQKNFANGCTKHLRLISASTRNNAILMWSHYAAKHTGVVIEFDMTEFPFWKITPEYLQPAEYSFRKADYLTHADRETQRRSMLAVVFRKAREWKYEREVRILLAKEDLSDGLTLLLTPKSIKTVILGCRIAPKSEAGIRVLLARKKLQHVALRRAELHDSRYALRIAAA